MNTLRQHSNSSARGAIALGLLVALAAAIGASEARPDEVIAYAESLAPQVAAEKSELDGAMRSTAATATRSLNKELKTALARQIKPIKLAAAPVKRGRG